MEALKFVPASVQINAKTVRTTGFDNKGRIRAAYIDSMKAFGTAHMSDGSEVHLELVLTHEEETAISAVIERAFQRWKGNLNRILNPEKGDGKQADFKELWQQP